MKPIFKLSLVTSLPTSVTMAGYNLIALILQGIKYFNHTAQISKLELNGFDIYL